MTKKKVYLIISWYLIEFMPKKFYAIHAFSLAGIEKYG